MKKFWNSGVPLVWLTAGGLAISLLLVAGLVLLILSKGLGFFWPQEVVRLVLDDQRELVGQIVEREKIPNPGSTVPSESRYRIQLKQGNRDLYGMDFLWVDEAQIVLREVPRDVVIIEREEWGDFFGFLTGLKDIPNSQEQTSDATWTSLQDAIARSLETRHQIKKITKGSIGKINRAQEENRLEMRSLEMQGVTQGAAVEALRLENSKLQDSYEALVAKTERLRATESGEALVTAAGGHEISLPIPKLIRVYRPNQMSFFSKCRFYLVKAWEFVWEDPRESNTEGGVFPAIFGTVLMVFIMSLVVAPLGVVAAFYLREYAKQGVVVSAIRIAVNNLAGVPSIVFGVFGVGFFIYTVGGTIDRVFYPEALPTPTYGTGGILWASLTLALLTVPVVIVATEEGLAAIPRGMREASLALGATKFETTWRIVLPAVLPSMLTGLILAMARAAGEVAPLMITGVVKLAPSLPLDSTWPFLHLNRKFMHLGFHIFDVGFQSPNVDAARPMVYTTSALLLLLVVVLNFGAISLRNRLRKKLNVSTL